MCLTALSFSFLRGLYLCDVGSPGMSRAQRIWSRRQRCEGGGKGRKEGRMGEKVPDIGNFCLSSFLLFLFFCGGGGRMLLLLLSIFFLLLSAFPPSLPPSTYLSRQPSQPTISDQTHSSRVSLQSPTKHIFNLYKNKLTILLLILEFYNIL